MQKSHKPVNLPAEIIFLRQVVPGHKKETNPKEIDISSLIHQELPVLEILFQKEASPSEGTKQEHKQTLLVIADSVQMLDLMSLPALFERFQCAASWINGVTKSTYKDQLKQNIILTKNKPTPVLFFYK